jgi:hypothetical protein
MLQAYSMIKRFLLKIACRRFSEGERKPGAAPHVEQPQHEVFGGAEASGNALFQKVPLVQELLEHARDLEYKIEILVEFPSMLFGRRVYRCLRTRHV